jgi:uncharacterized protein YjbI with pentapeptide repeats
MQSAGSVAHDVMGKSVVLEPGVVLCDVDLSQERLERVNLAGAHLTNVHFGDGHLVGVNFTDVTMDSVTFTSSHVDRCTFSGVRGQMVDFTSAVLVSSTFEKASIEALGFNAATLDYVSLVDLNAPGIYLGDAQLVNCSLRRAVLGSAEMGHCIIGKCDVTGADFSEAHLHECWWDSPYDIPKGWCHADRIEHSLVLDEEYLRRYARDIGVDPDLASMLVEAHPLQIPKEIKELLGAMASARLWYNRVTST